MIQTIRIPVDRVGVLIGTKGSTKLKIEKSVETEKHERERREVEHMVGLQKKRADQEQELAVKAAELAVREGNLSAKEDQFEERLKNVTEQLLAQIEYLRTDIIAQILQRLPTFEVKTALEPHRLLAAGRNGGNGDGDGDGD